jgi:hypothetical protein
MLNFDITSGNVIRANFGGFGADREEYVFSGAAGSLLDITSAVDLRIDGISAPRGYRDANVTNNGDVANSTNASGGAEAAVPSASWDVEPTYTFIDGRLYALHLQGYLKSSVATVQAGIIRVRKGAGTVAGTQLARCDTIVAATGVANPTQGFDFVKYTKNTSGADVATKLSMTIDRTVGVGDYIIGGVADEPLILAVEDIGLVADQPGIAANAVSV